MQQTTNIQAIEAEINKYEQIVTSENNVIFANMEEHNRKNERKDIIKKLKRAEEEIENKEGIESNIAFKELRQKYKY
ncbi:MAG: hypothetical protein HFJ40_04870 [Clostridia bacterium]|nr:hypothetical protein [Clostridia bacterium]